jgi:hypothetical protein
MVRFFESVRYQNRFQPRRHFTYHRQVLEYLDGTPRREQKQLGELRGARQSQSGARERGACLGKRGIVRGGKHYESCSKKEISKSSLIEELRICTYIYSDTKKPVCTYGRNK